MGEHPLEGLGLDEAQAQLVPHSVVMGLVNPRVLEHINASGEDDPALVEREAILYAGIKDLYTSTFDNPEVKSRLTDIAGRIRLADNKFFSLPAGQQTAKERFAYRLAAFEGIGAYSDFDITWTTHSEYNEASLPGSRHIEPLLAQHGRESFPRIFHYWATLLETHPHLFERPGKELRPEDFRPGIKEFIEFMRSQGHDLRIISASFKAFVAAATQRFGMQPQNIHACEPLDITSTQKGLKLASIAHQDPSKLPVIIGDGPTDARFLELDDIPGIEGVDLNLKSIIGMAFALKGAGLEKELQARGVPYISYTDFHEIREALEYICARAAQIRLEHPELAYANAKAEVSSRRNIV